MSCEGRGRCKHCGKAMDDHHTDERGIMICGLEKPQPPPAGELAKDV